MLTLEIRPAEPADTEVIVSLIEEIERYYGSSSVQPVAEREAQVKLALFAERPMAHVLLARDRDEVVGLAAYTFLWPAAGSTSSLFLKELYVRESGRRKRIGSQLMAKIQRIAAEQPGCSRVEWTADRDNATARQFYRKLGFEEFSGKVVYRVATAS